MPNRSRPTLVLLCLLAAAATAGPTGCDRAAPSKRAKPPASLPVPSHPAPVATALKVVSVHHGDTLRAIDAANVENKVWLLGIDAPEIGQPYGTRSRDALAGMVKGKVVDLVGTEKDRYGRTLTTVIVDGANVNLEMVRQGLAWHFRRSPSDQGARRFRPGGSIGEASLVGRSGAGPALGVAGERVRSVSCPDGATES